MWRAHSCVPRSHSCERLRYILKPPTTKNCWQMLQYVTFTKDCPSASSNTLITGMRV